jgi:hypothetical protein
MEKKKIQLRRIGKRGKHPLVDFEPTDVGNKKGKLQPIREAKLIITAKSKSGRKVTRKFRDYKSASEHYHKWLRKSHLRDVSMKTEERKCQEKILELAADCQMDSNVLLEVFNRGVIDHAKSNVASLRPDITPTQWGMARVNSFIHGGRARKLDEDLQNDQDDNNQPINNSSFDKDVRHRRNKKHARPPAYAAQRAARPVGMDEARLDEISKEKVMRYSDRLATELPKANKAYDKLSNAKKYDQVATDAAWKVVNKRINGYQLARAKLTGKSKVPASGVSKAFDHVGSRIAGQDKAKLLKKKKIKEELEESVKLKSVKTHKAEAPKPNVLQMRDNIQNRISKMQADSRAKLLKSIKDEK